MNARTCFLSGLTGLMLVVVLLSAPTPEAAAQGSGNSAAVEVQRAETFVAQGEFVQALAAARSALQKDPSSFRARYYASFALLGLKRFDEAGVEAEKALALAPGADRPMAEKLIATIALQRDSLTAEADAEAALAAGLNAKAARLYAQAYEADSNRTEAGFKAADLYTDSLNDTTSAALLLRDLEKNARSGEVRARARADLIDLAPKISPIAKKLISQASMEIRSGDYSKATLLLDEIETLDPENNELMIQRVRSIALADDDDAMERSLANLIRGTISLDTVIFDIPRAAHWAERPWLSTFLSDYQGNEYAARTISAMKTGERAIFQGCPVCPEMVIVPPDNLSNDLGYRLAIGKFEVTWDEFDACVQTGSCDRMNDWGYGKGRHPAADVSLDQAQVYISWLNTKTSLTGQPERYRLLTEKEWEFAARSGTSTAYWWGNTASHEYANYGTDKCCKAFVSGPDVWETTSPVGQFPANPFGLYDMNGNVWEWVDGCVQEFKGKPGKCQFATIRGGSFISNPEWVTATSRYGYVSGGKNHQGIGFRIARTLPE